MDKSIHSSFAEFVNPLRNIRHVPKRDLTKERDSNVFDFAPEKPTQMSEESPNSLRNFRRVPKRDSALSAKVQESSNINLAPKPPPMTEEVREPIWFDR